MRLRSRRLADLKNRTVELERKLSDARVSLERELAQFAGTRGRSPARSREARGYAFEDAGLEHEADELSAMYAVPQPSPGYGGSYSEGPIHSSQERTEVFLNHGRSSAYHRGLSRGRLVGIATIVVALLITAVVITLTRGGASWPQSVLTVQGQVDTACQNPDVRSEPGLVNFACAKNTRQILWALAMLTSGNDPNFADARTGRIGLEPISPAQGGEVAWSLNLHHPYSPTNPIDSIAVAARAINNIIGGATITGAHGNPVVQPGLESDPANCLRYTGSKALTSRKGFPDLCAKPVTSAAGQAALVADVYQEWVVGASPRAAQDAAALFTNAHNPGDPRVQAILKALPNLNR